MFLPAAGIMNELASLVGNYFADNLTELKKLGLSYTHLRYSSQRAIPRNAAKLFQDVLDIAAKVCPDKLTVNSVKLCHSKEFDGRKPA